MFSKHLKFERQSSTLSYIKALFHAQADKGASEFASKVARLAYSYIIPLSNFSPAVQKLRRGHLTSRKR